MLRSGGGVGCPPYTPLAAAKLVDRQASKKFHLDSNLDCYMRDWSLRKLNMPHVVVAPAPA